MLYIPRFGKAESKLNQYATETLKKYKRYWQEELQTEMETLMSHEYDYKELPLKLRLIPKVSIKNRT